MSSLKNVTVGDMVSVNIASDLSVFLEVVKVSRDFVSVEYGGDIRCFVKTTGYEIGNDCIKMEVPTAEQLDRHIKSILMRKITDKVSNIGRKSDQVSVGQLRQLLEQLDQIGLMKTASEELEDIVRSLSTEEMIQAVKNYQSL